MTDVTLRHFAVKMMFKRVFKRELKGCLGCIITRDNVLVYLINQARGGGLVSGKKSSESSERGFST